MDSTNKLNKAEERDFDIRDVANYLLGKFWIIVLAVVCFAVAAIIYTSTITPKYTSNSSLFIINAQDGTVSSSQISSNINVGKQLAVTSPELVTLQFCYNVAQNLNMDPNFTKTFTPFDLKISDSGNYSADIYNLYNSIKVSSDEETCIVTFTVTTVNAYRSKLIADEVARSFGSHIQTFMDLDTIRTVQAKYATANSTPSNIHTARNAIIAALVGGILACAALVIIFIFDDKIKTPDDIDRYLALGVLGVIPEIDTEA